MITPTVRKCGRDSQHNGQRSLGAAEGVLVALRQCSLDDAFADIIDTAKRQNVPPIKLADALVAMAQGKTSCDVDSQAMAAANAAWAPLLERRAEGITRAKYPYAELIEPIPSADEVDLLEQQLAITEDGDYSPVDDFNS